MRPILIAATVTFLIDQISKYIIVEWLDLKTRLTIDVLPPLINFRMAWNNGINFGFLDVSRWLLIAVALVISGWVFWWIKREERLIARISGGILIGGALGNVIDRVIYGAVADFLNMSCCGIENPYSFNIADIAIFAGAIGLIFFTGSEKST